METGGTTGRARGKAWEITVDFVETLALAAVVGALASLALAALALLLSAHAEAAESALHGPSSGALMLRTRDGGEPAPAPLLATEVSMRVTGLVARVRVSQHFANPGTGWQEGLYVFPLPEDAAVDALAMRIGARTVEGVIRERGAARRAYEHARESGRRTSLLEQERPNLFTASVANVGPGETVTVDIEYQQALRFERGEVSLRFPLAITPRYVPGEPLDAAALAGRHRAATGPLQLASAEPAGWSPGTSLVPDAARITPPVPHPDALGGRVLNPVSLEVELDAGMALAALESPSHDLRVTRLGEGRYRLAFAADAVPADRDFELAWRPAAGAAPRAAVFTEQRDGETYALVVVVPPEPAAAAPRLPREAIFVVDTSGSMEGASIAQAREALIQGFARLQPGDTFNVIAFDSGTRRLFEAPRPVTAASLAAARRWVRGLRASGGTEMAAALREALDGRGGAERLRQVVFLTDGAVANEAQLFELIRAKLGASRLFTIGIGSAPNSHFMTRAAAHGGGTFTYIARVEEVAEKVGALFEKLEAPVLRDVAIEWPAGTEAWPRRVPDLYAGEPIVVAARLPGAADTVQIRGGAVGAEWAETVPLAGGVPEAGIGKLWARRKIDALLDAAPSGGDPDDVRGQVVRVALAHGLVTRHTSLVAVDTTPVRAATEPLESAMLPVDLPHGMVHEAVFGELPRTATPALLHVLAGALAAVLAALSWLLHVRRAAQ